MSSNLQTSWFALTAVALAVVVTSVFLITLVIALISRRGRAVASILVTTGLLVFFVLAVVWYMNIGHGHIDLDQEYLTADVSLAREAVPLVTLQPEGPDDAPSPPEPAPEEKKPNAKSTKPAKSSSSDSDAPKGTEEAKTEQLAPDDNRPDWVGGKPFKDGPVYKVPVTVGPWPTAAESMKRLPEAVDKEIAKYSVSRAGYSAAAKLRLPPDYVMNHMIAKDVWEEALKIDSFDDVKHMVGRDVWENSENPANGRWNQLHVLVKFDDDVNRRLDDGWDRQDRVERLMAAGVLGAIVMLLLGAVYSYLSIDLKTGGVYRGRLRVGAVAAILLVITLVLLNHV